jgi:hypothetical protein
MSKERLKAPITTIPQCVKDLVAAKGELYRMVKRFIQYRARRMEFSDCKFEENVWILH